jgi:hypothetical protein
VGRHEKKTYLETIRQRYKNASKSKKGIILSEFCETFGYNRKYAIRQLNKKPKRRKVKARPGRPRYEKTKLIRALKVIWRASEQMCSKKLKAALPEWLPHYEQENEVFSDSVRGQFYSLSSATIDRWLAPYREENKSRKGLCGTKPGTLLKNQIPIKTNHWDVNCPGFLEADTVAHCGNSLAGDFVWSITYTDIFSTWTEIRATWNKGGEGVKEQTMQVEACLPFPILGFDCDNGSEFLNWHLIRYFTERQNTKPVQFTRSRPYHKDDNAHVEQKNWTHVRQLLGYQRFDDVRLVAMMNDLYCNEWSLYQNHFSPSMKLKEKIKINSRYQKKYDLPKTPYQRLLDSEHIADEIKARLKAKHALLNPFALKRIIHQKVNCILQLASVTSSMRQRI